jgi:hypothetical protein
MAHRIRTYCFDGWLNFGISNATIYRRSAADSALIDWLWSVRDGRGTDFAVTKAYALQGDA